MAGKLESPGDSERRQRPRKSVTSTAVGAAAGLRDSPRPLIDALDARLLTPQVWQELFDIFQTHYSADLPFLHHPTFIGSVRQAGMPPPSKSAISANSTTTDIRPPASDEFLLGFLALTARFHTKLVAHHSPPTSSRPSNPLVASMYYATAAKERLSAFYVDNNGFNIERMQATLFLGLHDWGMCQGAKAWLTVGVAIRTAQAAGLQYEQDLDDEPMSVAQALAREEVERVGIGSRSRKPSTGSLHGEADSFVKQEICRRTFWSCYILDRYLSSGKYRPQMLHAKDLRIQLPVSEQSFIFAEKVRTGMLGETEPGAGGSRSKYSVTPDRRTALTPQEMLNHDLDDERGRLQTGSEEGLVSRYIKMLEIYGRVVQWSCAGGRR